MLMKDNLHDNTIDTYSHPRYIKDAREAMEEIVSSMAVEISQLEGDLVIPLSGGIQSTFTASIAAAAGVKTDIVHVKRRGETFHGQESKNAHELAGFLKLPYRSIAVDDEDIIEHVKQSLNILSQHQEKYNITSKDVMNNVIWRILNKSFKDKIIIMGSGFNTLMGNGRAKNNNDLNKIVISSHKNFFNTAEYASFTLDNNDLFVPSLTNTVFDSFSKIEYNIFSSTNIIRQSASLLGVPDNTLRINHISPMDSLSVSRIINNKVISELREIGDNPRNEKDVIASMWIRNNQ